MIPRNTKVDSAVGRTAFDPKNFRNGGIESVPPR